MIAATRADKIQAVLQGEHLVSRCAQTVMTTVLGSCVAACLYDPIAGIGGMNHFVLPGRRATDPATMRFGVHAMAVLIDDLLQQGAVEARIEAKLFGGACMLNGLPDIGARNCEFAEDYLKGRSIPLVSSSLGGSTGRKIRFQPTTGLVQQFRIPRAAAPDLTLAEFSRTERNKG